MESLLVERLAHYAWRMRRAVVFEQALFADGPFYRFRLGYHSNLLRYEMALANASCRTLQQLLFLQDRRRERKSRIVEAESPVEITARLVPAVAAE
jgi:hypothetical protein